MEFYIIIAEEQEEIKELEITKEQQITDTYYYNMLEPLFFFYLFFLI